MSKKVLKVDDFVIGAVIPWFFLGDLDQTSRTEVTIISLVPSKKKFKAEYATGTETGWCSIPKAIKLFNGYATSDAELDALAIKESK
tara:strand:+ start:78 stop:338 length:261 start_codon:yes stop_codon:yes gene_type:complete